MTAIVIRLPKRRKTEQEKVWVKISSNLVLHKKTGTYYVRKEKAGKTPLFKSTGETTKVKAQHVADAMCAEWLGGRLSTGKRQRVSDVCSELLQAMEQEYRNADRAWATYDHDKTYLPILSKLFGDTYVEDFDEAYWDSWVRTEGRRSGRSLFDISKYLSKVLTYAHARKYINRKPKIRNPDRPKETGPIYENEIIETFIKHSDPTLRDLIIIGAECGLRPHENRELRWDMVEIDKDAVTLSLPSWFTKTRKARELRVSPHSEAILRARLLSRDKASPYVFPAPSDPLKPLSKKVLSTRWRKMLKAAKEAAKLEGHELKTDGLRFHWMRHSFYTKALLEAKLPVQEVSEYGGTSISTLQKRYLRSNAIRTKSVSLAVKLNLDPVKDP